MVAIGRPKAAVVLDEEDRDTLERWARRPTTAQALALRCRIVLACAEGGSDVGVAEGLSVNRGAVGRRRRRFL